MRGNWRRIFFFKLGILMGIWGQTGKWKTVTWACVWLACTVPWVLQEFALVWLCNLLLILGKQLSGKCVTCHDSGWCSSISMSIWNGIRHWFVLQVPLLSLSWGSLDQNWAPRALKRHSRLYKMQRYPQDEDDSSSGSELLQLLAFHLLCRINVSV